MDRIWQLDLDGVAVMRWPADDALRWQLAGLGMPRLLLLEPGVSPPDLVGPSEDWLRLPASADDVAARAAMVRTRTASPDRPSLDDAGLLRVGAQWVAMSPAQLPVVSLLVERFERVVRTDEIVQAYATSGGSGSSMAVRTLMGRIAARATTVGLRVVTIRRRGAMLRLASDVHSVRSSMLGSSGVLQGVVGVP
ncbi:MAG: hypothetical protein ACRDYW_01130 [Acidimicrobiales bacterium]